MIHIFAFVHHSGPFLSDGSNVQPRKERAISSSLNALAIVAFTLGVTATAVPQALAQSKLNDLVVRQEGWLVKSYSEIANPILPANTRNEIAELKTAVARRSPEDIERLRWWTTGGPTYRWNEIILDEMQASFVTLPLAARHLALYQAALDDALVVASSYRKDTNRSDSDLDAALKYVGKP